MPKNNYTPKNKAKRKGRNTSKGGQTPTTSRRTGANNYVPGGVDSYDDIKSNDISWYDKASYLFSEATRVPFDVIAGAPFSYSGSHAGIDNRSNHWDATGNIVPVEGEAVPGIMAIKYYPFIGYSDSINSPINRAFTTMFGDLQSKTTGILPFQQADLAMFVTSTSSIAALLGHVKRIMEIATLYTPMNYYYPVDLMTSMLGTAAQAMDVIQNRDVYRSRVNNLVFQFNSLKIPSFVDVFKRQYAISHNVYADEDDVQAQLYVFVPQGYYQYFDTEMSIKMQKLPNPATADGGINFQTLLDAVQNCLDAWRNSSDLPLINGALMRAYPDNEFVKIDMLNVDSTITPVCDRNILWQINNSRSVKVVEGSMDVKQDAVNNFLISQPRINISGSEDTFYRSWVYLNSFDFNESPEFIMEATRLIPYIDAEVLYDEKGKAYGILNTAVTELISTYTVYVRERTPDGNILRSNSFTTDYLTDNVGKMRTLALLSRWRNAPRVTLWGQRLEGEDFKEYYVGEFGDLAHYTRLDQSQLTSLHEAAAQSLYWIDSMNLRV